MRCWLKSDGLGLALELIPALERAGLKARADAVFGKVFDLHEKKIRDWPRSSLFRNNVVWLATLCRRRLDAALKHATEAVKLKPDDALHINALAEVHFLRGNQAEAVKLMKRCIELDPESEYHRKQLKRFESGDRTSLPPGY